MILRRTVFLLGLSQIVCWGTAYYLIGGFGHVIAADLGWSPDLVYGGFSVALLVMGCASPLAGRLINRHGGRGIMAIGSVLIALGCVGIALSHGVALYYASWVCLGFAMRLTLYDAAFATLALFDCATYGHIVGRLLVPSFIISAAAPIIYAAVIERTGSRAALMLSAAVALLALAAAIMLHLRFH